MNDFWTQEKKEQSFVGGSLFGGTAGSGIDISYPKAIPSDDYKPISTLSQTTGTSQFEVGVYSERDIVKRVASLEAKIERIESFFSISSSSINTLSNEKWELVQPLILTVEQRAKDEFIACLYDVDLYGYGETIPEALEELKINIVNQYEYLLEQERVIELGSFPKLQLSFFKKFLVNLNV